MSDLKKLLLLLCGLTLLRCLWAVQMPLIAGEAYYWLWNWRPDAGYFDHPPMVSVVSLALGGRILGSQLAVRFPAILLGALSTLALYRFGRLMFPQSRAAFWAAAFFSVAPIFDLNAMFLTPDNALVLFTTLTWICFWGASNRPERVAAWFTAGLCAGLALLSKFHAWVLLPPLYLFLLLSPKHRPLLKTAGPWFALTVAAIVLSPNLIWNARHDWLNYAFQWRRSALPQSHFEPSHIFAYFLAPLATLSPLVYVAMLGGIFAGFRAWRRTGDPRWLYLLCAGLPLPLFLGALTPLTEISLHWPASAYGALVLLFAGLIEEGLLFTRSFYKPALAIAAAMTAIVHIAPAIVPHLPDRLGSWAGPLDDLARYKKDFVGWPEIGAVAAKEREAMLAENPDTPVIVMAKNWHEASLLAFYSRLPLEASPYTAADLHNFLLWDAARNNLKGFSAVVILDVADSMQQHSTLRKKYQDEHRLLDPLFATVEEQPSLVVFPDGKTAKDFSVSTTPPRLREFMLFRCKNFKGQFVGDGVSK